MNGSLPKLPSVAVESGATSVEGRLSVGSLRREVLERDEELLRPLDPKLDTEVALATAKFEKLGVSEQHEIFRTFFKSRILERAAWTMPTTPTFFPPEPEFEKEAHARNVTIAQSLLTTGLLPTEDAIRAVQAVGASIPNYRAHATFMLASLTSAGVIATAFFASPWITTATVIGGLIFCRGFASRPNLHMEYGAGYLMETMDAFHTLKSGSTKSLSSTIDSYFKDPHSAENYLNLARADAFLISRTLRLLGHSNHGVYQAFRDPRTVNMENNDLALTVLNALQEHRVNLQSPLGSTFLNSEPRKNDTPVDPECQDPVEFLEAIHAAHFAWGERDKDNLRLEFAHKILAYEP